MAYYSFYRIIKDIIKTIFGRNIWKITLIVFITFTLFFIWGEITQVKAVNITKPSIVSIEDIVPSGYNYFCYYNPTTNRYIVYVYDGNVIFSQASIDSDIYLLFSNCSQITWYRFINDDWSLADRYSVNGSFTISSPISSYNIIENLYLSSNNIYDNNNNIIFKKQPTISTNIEDLQTLNFDNLSCVTNGYYEDDVYLLIYDRSATGNEGLDALYPAKEILLNRTNYYQSKFSEQNAIYFIPIEDLRCDLYCWK